MLPETERLRSGWERGLAIVVRAAHVGAMAVLVGGVYFAAPASALRLWGVLTVATGAVLLAIEASHSRHWIYQGRGIATILHGALALLLVAGAGAPPRPLRSRSAPPAATCLGRFASGRSGIDA